MQLFDEDAERVVLGSLVQEPGIITETASLLKPEDYYFEKNQLIYKTILAEYEANEAVDPLAIITRLKNQNELEKSGNRSYVLETFSMGTSLSLATFQNRIKSLALRRQVITALKDIQGLALDTNIEVEEMLNEADLKISKIANQSVATDVQHIRTFEKEFREHLQNLFKNRGNPDGLSSGFKGLDFYTQGFHPGQLIILAARPSIGKTALALNMALNAAYHHKSTMLIFSLEMSRMELTKRLVSTHAHVEGQKLMKGNFSKAESEKIASALSEIMQTDLYIDDSAGLTSWDFKQRSRKLARELKTQGKKIGLIIVDYLQLMTETGRMESRQTEVAAISRTLKLIAKELDVPVLALSQMNRSIEQRGKNPQPQLSDLRESGAIEQDADIVLFLHREDFGKREEEVPENKRGLAEIILAKNRSGPTGIATMVFQKHYYKFVDHEYERPKN